MYQVDDVGDGRRGWLFDQSVAFVSGETYDSLLWADDGSVFGDQGGGEWVEVPTTSEVEEEYAGILRLGGYDYFDSKFGADHQTWGEDEDGGEATEASSVTVTNAVSTAQGVSLRFDDGGRVTFPEDADSFEYNGKTYSFEELPGVGVTLYGF